MAWHVAVQGRAGERPIVVMGHSFVVVGCYYTVKKCVCECVCLCVMCFSTKRIRLKRRVLHGHRTPSRSIHLSLSAAARARETIMVRAAQASPDSGFSFCGSGPGLVTLLS